VSAPTRSPGPRPARAGLAALALVLAAVVAGCADSDAPDWLTELGAPTTTAGPATTTTAPTAPGGSATTLAATTPVTDLVAGDCVDGGSFAAGATGEVTDTQIADCAAEHDGEVVGVVTYTQGPSDPYPGPDQVAAYADEQCAIAFEAYVGVAYGSSPLQMVSLWPTDASWAAGDREAVCVAFSPDGPLTASVQGSAAGA